MPFVQLCAKHLSTWLAVLFVVAVISLEVHIEFDANLAIYIYALLFLVILVVYLYARWRCFR